MWETRDKHADASTPALPLPLDRLRSRGGQEGAAGTAAGGRFLKQAGGHFRVGPRDWPGGSEAAVTHLRSRLWALLSPAPVSSPSNLLVSVRDTSSLLSSALTSAATFSPEAG